MPETNERPPQLGLITERNPPVAAMVNWLKANLALTIFLCTMISSAVGMLIHTTLRYADASYQLADLQSRDTTHDKTLKQLQDAMVDVDRRLNIGTENVGDLRRARDKQVSDLESRIAVLEAQIRFLAERTPTPTIGKPR